MPIEHDYKVGKLVDDYLAEHENEVREATLSDQTYHLRALARWTDDVELGPATNLNGYTVNQFKTWIARTE